MTLHRPFHHIFSGILLLLLAFFVIACTDDISTPPALTTPPPVQSTPVNGYGPAPELSSTLRVTNTLAIAEPLPGTVVGNSVTVKGEGMAFENTILVEVVASQGVLGRAIVTTVAEPGHVGYFTETVTVAPVAEDTDGLVTIYTTSPVDGTVDQRASVPVKIKASDKPPASTRTIVTKPNIRINPTRGRPGTEITVVGGNFPAGSEVQIRLSSLNSGTAPEVYATTEVGQHGNIQASFIMPAKWPNGEPILLTEVLIVASTPDFVVKATAEFTLETQVTPRVQVSPTAPPQ